MKEATNKRIAIVTGGASGIGFAITQTFVKNNIALNEMNKSSASLTGKAKKYAMLSSLPEFDHIDGGNDYLFNRIIWFASMGNKPYPQKMTLPKKDRKEEDD